MCIQLTDVDLVSSGKSTRPLGSSRSLILSSLSQFAGCLLVTAPFHEGLGVRRGETVFIHPPGKTNGFEVPRVPRIGEIEPWVRSNPFSQSGQLDGWRAEMASIGADIATRRSAEVLEEGTIRSFPPIGTFLWLGEVTSVCFLLLLEVILANRFCRSFALMA